MNIIDALHDDRFFKTLFDDLDSWANWEIYLKALFGLPISESERPLLKAATGLESVSKEGYDTSYVIASRRSGKSRIASCIAIWLSTFKDWKKELAVGEKAMILIVANDKDQASIIKSYISEGLASVPSFKRLVKKDKAWTIELRNGVIISVKAGNYRGIRGYTLLAVILEEISFYRSDESANPDKEIVRAVQPGLATLKGSLQLAISSPYIQKGVLWESWKKWWGKSEEGSPLIWKMDSLTMNPTLNKKKIDQAFIDDPEAAAAEWGGRWREDIKSLIPPELVRKAVVERRFELPKMKGVEYSAAIDPSGGRVDSFSMAITFKEEETGQIILAMFREQKAPFKPETVVTNFSEILKQWGISEIESDRYAGEWVTDAFRRNGIEVVPSALSKSDSYIQFLPLLTNGRIELLDHEIIISQFSNLERKTRSGGKDQIDNFHGKDDVSNVIALSANRADREGGSEISWVYHAGMPISEEEEDSEQEKEEIDDGSWIV